MTSMNNSLVEKSDNKTVEADRVYSAALHKPGALTLALWLRANGDSLRADGDSSTIIAAEITETGEPMTEIQKDYSNKLHC